MQSSFKSTSSGNLLIVKTDNNLLTYIMTTPNLDATRHQWVESLAQFTLSIKYQKEHENAAIDTLSCVTSKLNTETTVKYILDGVTVGTTERADAHDLAVAEAVEEIHKSFQGTVILAQAAHVDLHVTDWVTPQQEDLILKTVIIWISD